MEPIELDTEEKIKEFVQKFSYAKNLVFRGQRVCPPSWELQNTLRRESLKGEGDVSLKIKDKIEKEKGYLEELRGKLIEFYSKGKESGNICRYRLEQLPTANGQLLAYLAHFKKPTRYLDWTKNINIALYFACENKDKDKEDNNDGSIFCLDIKGVSEYFRANEPKSSKDIWGAGDHYFKVSVEAYLDLNTRLKGKDILIPVSPYEPNERELQQEGVFTLSCNPEKTEKEILEKMFGKDELVSKKILVELKIRKEDKVEIMKYLEEEENICRESLFNPIEYMVNKL